MSDIINSLNWRYATKSFDSTKKVSEKDLDELLEVMRLAPSSFGLQPWKFIIVENQELRKKIQEKAWNQAQITESSHLIVVCAKTDITGNDITDYIKDIAKTRGIPEDSLNGYQEMMIGFRKGLNNEQVKDWCKRQTYIPLGMLLQTAAMKKIDACPMEGFDPKAIDEILSLKSQGLTSVALCPIGYRSSKDKTSEYKKVRFQKNKVVEKR